MDMNDTRTCNFHTISVISLEYGMYKSKILQAKPVKAFRVYTSWKNVRISGDIYTAPEVLKFHPMCLDGDCGVGIGSVLWLVDSLLAVDIANVDGSKVVVSESQVLHHVSSQGLLICISFLL